MYPGLRHRNIVRVEAVLEPEPPGTAPIVVQECLLGPTLASVLSSQDQLPPHKQLYSPRQATRWALGIASALEYLHSGHGDRVVIHRDISTANLVLTSHKLAKADIKLVDFGLSAVISRAQAHGPPLVAGAPAGARSSDGALLCGEVCVGSGGARWPEVEQEQGGQMMSLTGTMLHSAPEMRTSAYTHKVDVFSFGVILFQLFTYSSAVATIHRSGCTVKDGHARMEAGWRPYIPLKHELDAKNRKAPRGLRTWLTRCISGGDADWPDGSPSGRSDESAVGQDRRRTTETSDVVGGGATSSSGDLSAAQLYAQGARRSFTGIPALAPHISHAMPRQGKDGEGQYVQV
eukprot:jgi/Tetstr1/434447/TSEL_023547.t1